MSAEQRVGMNTVLVRVKTNYGSTVAYPANENARLFAAIGGTLTLRPADLERIGALGFAVVVERRDDADVLASLGVSS